jgi:hypothetical protein
MKLSKAEQDKISEMLKEVLEKSRGKLDDLEFDPEANEEYDEDMASIGSEEEEEI